MAYTTVFGKLVRVGVAKNRGGLSARVLPSDKGKYNGSCNRSACLRPGAQWYNHSTRKYYCDECAHWLNADKFNHRDAMKLYGHDLCTLGEQHDE